MKELPRPLVDARSELHFDVNVSFIKLFSLLFNSQSLPLKEKELIKEASQPDSERERRR